MPNQLDGQAMGGSGDQTSEKKLCDCKWKDCPKQIHEKEINYSNKGTVSRNSSYKKDWVAAGLEPWENHGGGINSKATLEDYRKETPKAQYAVTAAAMKYPEYHTQKHHLISVNLFKKVTKLSHNAKLIDYDVNHENNGICLPTYVADIIRHDLQCHRGSHPNNLYNSKIDPLLKDLQEVCVKFCTSDYGGDKEMQISLMKNLNQLSRRIEGKVKTWKLLLRSNALKEREESTKIYNEKMTLKK